MRVAFLDRCTIRPQLVLHSRSSNLPAPCLASRNTRVDTEHHRASSAPAAPRPAGGPQSESPFVTRRRRPRPAGVPWPQSSSWSSSLNSSRCGSSSSSSSRFFLRPALRTAPTLCGATKTGLRRCAAVLECNVKSPSPFTVSLDSNARVPATKLRIFRTSGCHAQTRPEPMVPRREGQRARRLLPVPRPRQGPAAHRPLRRVVQRLPFCRSFSTASSSLLSSARSNLSSTSFLVEARSDFF